MEETSRMLAAMRPTTIRDLINLWPSRAMLAADLTAGLPGRTVTAGQVHKWAAHGSIPPRYHAALICAGQARGLSVDAALVVQLHAPRAAGSGSEDAA